MHRLEYQLKKNKPFDTNLQSILSNLVNSSVISKFNNSVLMQKKLFFVV